MMFMLNVANTGEWSLTVTSVVQPAAKSYSQEAEQWCQTCRTSIAQDVHNTSVQNMVQVLEVLLRQYHFNGQ